MAHVRPDELAGSPDVFASNKDAKPAGIEPAPMSTSEPEVAAEPAPAPREASIAPQYAPIAAIEPPAPFAPAPSTGTMASPPPVRRGSAGTAVGVVLVVVGLFYLIVQVAGIDLSSFGWPLFVIIPGLTLLIVGFMFLGTGAAVPGGIFTMVGLVLAYQSSTGNWASWVYAWALVAPGGVGLGLFLQGLRERSSSLIKQGRSLMFIALLIFLVGFAFFESVLDLSGMNDKPAVKAALPALFIVIGVLLLARNIQRSRRA
jgi:hypothetical protein